MCQHKRQRLGVASSLPTRERNADGGTVVQGTTRPSPHHGSRLKEYQNTGRAVAVIVLRKGPGEQMVRHVVDLERGLNPVASELEREDPARV